MPPATIQLQSPNAEPSTPFLANPNASRSQRLESLQELLRLEQQREHLQIQLDTTLKKITSLQLALFAGSARAELPRVSRLDSSHPLHRRSQPTPRMPRGELRRLIVKALESAGSEGIDARLLARELGIKSVNVHSWFHSALKKHPQIRKLAAGRYVLEGPLQLPPTLASCHCVPPAPARRSKSRIRRGEMSRQILLLLQSAGDKGISVPEIAARIGSHYRNVHVWFCSTGKRNFPIERVSRGFYRLKAPSLAGC
jgi:hypothetical protein